MKIIEKPGSHIAAVYNILTEFGSDAKYPDDCKAISRPNLRFPFYIGEHVEVKDGVRHNTFSIHQSCFNLISVYEPGYFDTVYEIIKPFVFENFKDEMGNLDHIHLNEN